MTRLGKWLLGIVSLALFGITTALFASETAKAKPAGHAAAKPVVWSADQLKWLDAPDSPGVKMATLWGDPTKGAFGALIKFPAGFLAPLHTHSSDSRYLVVSGTLIHSPEGGPETRLGPGSYVFEPHTYKHTTGCDSASECVIFASGNGKLDVKMAEEKKTMDKK